MKNKILNILSQPENAGDLHLKMLLSDSSQYGINKTLVEYFIKAYFTVLWDKKNELSEKVYLDILAGEHEEAAFVEIKTEMVIRMLFFITF